MKILLAICLSLICMQVLAATTWYVTTNGSDGADGTTWETAKQTIQAAIDVAASNDTVLVSNGVYATGGRVVYGAMTNRVAVTNAVTLRSANGPTVTTIRGKGPLGDSAVRCVYLGANAVLSGFTLTGGCTRVGSYGDNNGGGAWCETSATISNCVLSGNSADYCGGGTYDGTLYNCTLSNNTANDFGGGASVATLFNCVLTDNMAYGGGGAEGGTLWDCTLSNNWVSYRGGGAYFSTLYDCTLSDNYAGNVGGGTYRGACYNCVFFANTALTSGGGTYDSTVCNCTLSGNAAGSAGGGVRYGYVTNCIVYYNSAPSEANCSYAYPVLSCTTPDPGGTGNITNAPLFVDTGGRNYRLQTNSPCIDAGTNLYAIAVDYDGVPRPLDGNNDGLARWDMGAFEYIHPLADTDRDWLADTNEIATGTSAIMADTDGDGMIDGAEARAGTNPLDDESYLAVFEVERSSSGMKVTWSSVAGKTYDIERCGDLIEGSRFTLFTNVPAFAPANTVTDTTATADFAYYYWVRLVP